MRSVVGQVGEAFSCTGGLCAAKGCLDLLKTGNPQKKQSSFLLAFKHCMVVTIVAKHTAINK